MNPRLIHLRQMPKIKLYVESLSLVPRLEFYFPQSHVLVPMLIHHFTSIHPAAFFKYPTTYGETLAVNGHTTAFHVTEKDVAHY